MRDALKKIKTGDPLIIPAGAYNAFVDAAQAHRLRSVQLQRQPQAQKPSAQLVPIRNSSGGDIARFGILGIGGLVFDRADNIEAFNNQPLLDGVAPSVIDHFDAIVVAQEPIASGKVGMAMISGITPVQIDIKRQGAKTAGPKQSNTTLLETAAGPARILWMDSGTGQRWALVALGGPVDQSPAQIALTDGVHNDYLIVQLIDEVGSWRHTGTNLLVAKPWELRHNKDYYDSAITTLTTVDAQTVTVSDGLGGEDDETWKVTPAYKNYGYLTVGRVGYTGITSPSTMEWIDLNVAARHWSATCG